LFGYEKRTTFGKITSDSLRGCINTCGRAIPFDEERSSQLLKQAQACYKPCLAIYNNRCRSDRFSCGETYNACIASAKMRKASHPVGQRFLGFQTCYNVYVGCNRRAIAKNKGYNRQQCEDAKDICIGECTTAYPVYISGG